MGIGGIGKEEVSGIAASTNAGRVGERHDIIGGTHLPLSNHTPSLGSDQASANFLSRLPQISTIPPTSSAHLGPSSPQPLGRFYRFLRLHIIPPTRPIGSLNA